MTRKVETRKKKENLEKVEAEDTQLRLNGAWRLWKEWSDKMKKIRNTMTISITGRKAKKPKVKKDNCYLFGDSAIRRKRNKSLQLPGTQDTKICLLSHWAAMTLQNKKQVRFWFGLSKTLLSQSTNTKVYQLESCVSIGILPLLHSWLQVFTTVQC